MDLKEQFTQVRGLIKEQKYDEARAILSKIDHPQAQDWLNRLDTLQTRSAETVVTESNSPTQTQFIPLKALKSGDVVGSIAVGSKSASIVGVLLTTLVAIISGVLVGLGLQFSSQFFYLYIAQPLVIAAIAGFAIQFAIHIGKLRHAPTALLLGLLAAILLYGTYRVSEYFEFRRIIADEILQIEPTLSQPDTDFFIDEFLREETGRGGLLGFIQLQANEGLSVSYRSRGELFRTNPFFTYVYWFVEIILIIGLIMLMALDRARKPYCVETGNWLRLKKVGYLPQEKLDEFLNAINSGNYELAAQVIDPKNKSNIPVQIAMCNPNANEGLLKVEYEAGRDSKDIIEETIASGKLVGLIQRHMSNV